MMKGDQRVRAHAADRTQIRIPDRRSRSPTAENSTAATSSPPRRPSQFDSGPAIAAPMTQPRSAQEMVQPDRLPAAVSGKPERIDEIVRRSRRRRPR